jgi:hypothetical protein
VPICGNLPILPVTAQNSIKRQPQQICGNLPILPICGIWCQIVNCGPDSAKFRADFLNCGPDSAKFRQFGANSRCWCQLKNFAATSKQSTATGTRKQREPPRWYLVPICGNLPILPVTAQNSIKRQPQQICGNLPILPICGIWCQIVNCGPDSAKFRADFLNCGPDSAKFRQFGANSRCWCQLKNFAATSKQSTATGTRKQREPPN